MSGQMPHFQKPRSAASRRQAPLSFGDEDDEEEEEALGLGFRGLAFRGLGFRVLEAYPKHLLACMLLMKARRSIRCFWTTGWD